jgi:hypothetical protein
MLLDLFSYRNVLPNKVVPLVALLPRIRKDWVQMLVRRPGIMSYFIAISLRLSSIVTNEVRSASSPIIEQSYLLTI